MSSTHLESWLEELAAKQPTPGGGGAAALAAAISAGLIGMVSIYTTGEKWGEVNDRMQELSEKAAKLRLRALELMQADADAFQNVGAAYGQPKDTDAQKQQRQSKIQKALAAAAEPPTEVAQLAAKLVDLAAELVPVGNPNVISDVAVAASNAKAALEGAIVNIEINAKLLTDMSIQDTLRSVITDAERAITKAAVITADVRQRIAA